MSSKKEVLQKENVVQAVLVADTFTDEFLPISNDVPMALFPFFNKPILDHTLEFLSLGGVDETFLFCCAHADQIKHHIEKCIKQSTLWSLNMKVNIIVSESCRSFGDCLRDLDAKGLLRGDFVLLEPGVISNLKLLPILKKHNETAKDDKGAAMTLIFQEAGVGQIGRTFEDEIVIAADSNDRILFQKKCGHSKERKIEFPLEIFLENKEIKIMHNLKDTHIAICSSAVLPLFTDNFDFQTREHFFRGLLMNEEIMEGTIYYHIVKGNQFGGAITSWRTYQTMSHEVKNRWAYPLIPLREKNQILKNDVYIGKNTTINNLANILRSTIGENVKIGKNVKIEDSFIMSDCKIENGATITLSIIGPNCIIKSNSVISKGSVLGKDVVIEKGTVVEASIVQSKRPESCKKEDRLGEHAFKLDMSDEDGELDISILEKRLSNLHISPDLNQESSDEDVAFTDSEDELSYTQSPPPDDTKLFFTEVIDSLTRGFEDELQCDNLILEINSSRYAYNVSVSEVNYNVIKAILHMSLRQPTGSQYFSHLQRLLQYCFPILKNYIRNESAMDDCLEAIKDVATSNEKLSEKWVMFVLKWFYDKDNLSEESILKWSDKLVDENFKFHQQVKPFIDWLQEAEEATSDEDDD